MASCGDNTWKAVAPARGVGAGGHGGGVVAASRASGLTMSRRMIVNEASGNAIILPGDVPCNESARENVPMARRRRTSILVALFAGVRK